MLPAEYQQVEYLQSNNSSSSANGSDWIHINTGVYYFADFEIECQTAENVSNITCGCGDSRYGATLGRYSGSQPYYAFFATASQYYLTNVPVTTGGVFAWRGDNLYVNGGHVATLQKPTSTKQFILYGYVNGNYEEYYKLIRIFYCKLWDNDGNLIRHYIPCYRKSDNAPGMYDLVTQSFNSGAGSSGYFTVGQDL